MDLGVGKVLLDDSVPLSNVVTLNKPLLLFLSFVVGLVWFCTITCLFHWLIKAGCPCFSLVLVLKLFAQGETDISFSDDPARSSVPL